MKIKSTSVNSVVAIALIAILTLQFLWLFGIYTDYQKMINYRVSDILKQSIDEEQILRHKQLGGPATITLYPAEVDDTATVQNFKMVSANM